MTRLYFKESMSMVEKLTKKNAVILFILVCISISAVILMPDREIPIKQISGALTDTDGRHSVGMIPHKALYEIKLVSKHSGAQIVNISGQMYYEWKETCDAWVSDHRFNLIYEYADSPAMNITSDFTAYETFDRKSFNFSSRRKRNGTLYQELRGMAKIADLQNTQKNKNLNQAVYSMPEGLTFGLPENTLFPMAHTIELLNKIKSGEKFFSATVFDGSDEDGPVEINTFIGKPVLKPEITTTDENIDFNLINGPAWRMRMAFFPLAKHSAEADYEMDMVFHENGVVSSMMVEYKKFSVTQTLVALEEIEQTTNCAKVP